MRVPKSRREQQALAEAYEEAVKFLERATQTH